ncbi:hypothetical protein PROFUN_06950 [Planoprotostelium fungivorum]|uniref:Protein FAN n=1 Tax=Planoprotostelium fungivorum TaxID=1890364 RepID=A0A2P6NN54_9EUKA|nr:hypothetical protein PROFUN_06950 [Planoprotostelium fungivorum]
MATRSQRFSALLLDEGEYYFEDFGGWYYPPAESDESSARGRIKGRLKMCSRSFIFDPDEWSIPIFKFPFKFVTAPGIKKVNALNRFLSNDTTVFGFAATNYAEMKANNINAPYVFREEGRKVHRFSLNYVNLDNVLHRFQELLEISQNGQDDKKLKTIIDNRESSVVFDTSALEDFREDILLQMIGSRISPLVEDPGIICVTNKLLYFQPVNNMSVRPVEKYHLSDLQRVAKSRYVLRHVGLELFFSNKTSTFFVFKSTEDRDRAYTGLLSGHIESVHDTMDIEERESTTHKWQSGLISNFDYIMYLNSVAGRTYNDLTQYPVFPWVIADFTSRELDLNNKETFRDLSKPIGALNVDRLRTLRKRMAQMPEETHPFLYGTHYSAPGYVLFYLVRRDPDLMLRLQNGKFDAPSRMFHSMVETWQGVLNNAADVKELIPEFYNPENRGDFLINHQRLNLGVKENGQAMDNVVLPPWSTDAEDFVNKMREALECEYVSENLHKWFDLIFGYKQRGDEAIRADNVFYHLTYEGAVDIESIVDSRERQAIVDQIKEFGQTPKQIFTHPHPPRYSKSIRTSMEDIQPIQLSDLGISLEISAADSPRGWEDFENITEPNFSFKLHKDAITSMSLSRDSSTLYSVAADGSLKVYCLSNKKQLKSTNLSEMSLTSCQLSSDEKFLLVGSWDNNVYVYSTESGSIVDSIAAHDDAVTCVCLSDQYLLTGSWDATLKLWEYREGTISFLPLAEFFDHETEIHCADIDDKGTIASSGSADGVICIWDLDSRKLINHQPCHDASITSIRFSPDSMTVVSCCQQGFIQMRTARSLSLIFSLTVDSPAMCIDTDGKYVVVGSEDGCLRVWDTSNTKVKQLKNQTEAVSAVSVSLDGKVVVSACGGSIRMHER